MELLLGIVYLIFLMGGIIVDIEILKDQIIHIINGLVAYDLLDFIYKLLVHSREHSNDGGEVIEQ